MTDTVPQLDPETAPPPDLLGKMGATRRRLDALTRDSATESIAATTDGDAAETEERRRHDANTTAIAKSRDDGIETAARNRLANISTAQQICSERVREIDEEAKSMSVRIRRKAHENDKKAKEALEEDIWLAETVFEANENRPRDAFEERQKEIDKDLVRLDDLESRMIRETRRYKQLVPRRTGPSEEDLSGIDRNPQVTLRLELGAASTATESFRRLSIPRLFRGPIMVLPTAAFIGAGVGIAALTGSLEQSRLVTGGAIGLAAFLPALVVLFFFARQQIVRAWKPYSRSASLIRRAAELAIESSKEERTALEKQLAANRDREIKSANAKFKPIIAENLEKARERVTELERRIPIHKAETEATCADTTANAQADAVTAETEALTAHATAVEVETNRHQHQVTENLRERDARWTALEKRWFEGLEADLSSLEAIRDDLSNRFLEFTDPTWKAWKPSTTAPPAVALGRVHFDRTAVEGGPPTDPRLSTNRATSLELPAMIALPTRSSLQIDVDPEHRDAGMGLLRATMLRILATIPPGKARFTIMDPVGLGQNFAGFMHLEDEMPGLVGERIWTEPRQIEQKLTDITEHMETVIQKYLRNEFASIDAYNVAAGEIAEPYRFLVIADFPSNFTEEAARRLASILQSGPRCGVFTLLLRDRRGDMPEKFDVTDLDRAMVTVRSTQDGMIFDAEGMEDLKFTPAPGPPDDLLIEMARRVGHAAVEAGKVEVPFETIAPKPEEFWTGSTEKKVSVALGRAGATRLQRIDLGVGTAQHALVAGKTGSGKSTLLHAFITNLACWYSPDEVEFYLVDFKKGVEFKTYATHKLPHARAVAVESDREFGLSVLQGLDDELKNRGESYRAEGVQDLSGWRQKRPDVPMPRVLLVIDEFQELFVDDDRVSQEAGLLLDRLVRQGRAFGMHVLLGSQTLGGAFSLHRSTMGQMGVRIALQCNEQDSMMILSDDNVAARLLARPGEAIYNDQGGLVEGNSPFQVCWLPDSVREGYLERVAELAAKRPDAGKRSCIVFEGNAPASLASNVPLTRIIESAPEARPTSFQIWLGDAVAIKDPTAGVFRRQAGSNLALIGQQDEAAMAISAAALLAGCAAHRSGDFSALVLDGSTADDPNAGYLEMVAKAMPHDVEMPGFRESSDAVLALGAELARRIESGTTDGPPRLLLIHGLQRFRSLRRAEDDFGFSTDGDAPPTPDKVFASLLKDGPEHGIFVHAWADTVATLERCVDRQSMRGFDQRAMFQVGSADSSTLIDSPAASTLGNNRGLLFSEEKGTMEKFRPWGLPSEAFVAAVGRALASRAE
jgi:S-DNA-T family DNA segregation ATPase FtsK/SpoIIIE